MKKILVLGAAGMAGHVIYTFLKNLDKYDVVGTVNSNSFDGIDTRLDIFDRNKIENYIAETNPDIIINCIGMLIRSSKDSPDSTIYANSYFPHFLKKIAAKTNAKLIHISTDCVFSGKGGKYTEFSYKDANDIYGLSKSLGEIIDESNVTIRTSIIGPELKNDGEGLFNWFMSQTGHINGYKSNFWSGVTTLELAKFIEWILNSSTTGLVHLTNNVPISKFDLLTILNKVHRKNLSISGDKDYQCDKSFINTNVDITHVVPSYEEMMQQQLDFMLTNKNWYNHYFDGEI